MRSIVFATNNPHKVKEANEILDGAFHIISLEDIGCEEDLPETSPTIEGNALQKARYVYEHYGVDCFAEDTGLEVEALDGEPGVRSARYAGPEKDPQANIDLLLEKLSGKTNRKARFLTVIALILGKKEFIFEGIAEREIIAQRTFRNRRIRLRPRIHPRRLGTLIRGNDGGGEECREPPGKAMEALKEFLKKV
jgi:XTP/dITP diphosphohydrolase